MLTGKGWLVLCRDCSYSAACRTAQSTCSTILLPSSWDIGFMQIAHQPNSAVRNRIETLQPAASKQASKSASKHCLGCRNTAQSSSLPLTSASCFVSFTTGQARISSHPWCFLIGGCWVLMQARRTHTQAAGTPPGAARSLSTCRTPSSRA